MLPPSQTSSAWYTCLLCSSWRLVALQRVLFCVLCSLMHHYTLCSYSVFCFLLSLPRLQLGCFHYSLCNWLLYCFCISHPLFFCHFLYFLYFQILDCKLFTFYFSHYVMLLAFYKDNTYCSFECTYCIHEYIFYIHVIHIYIWSPCRPCMNTLVIMLSIWLGNMYNIYNIDSVCIWMCLSTILCYTPQGCFRRLPAKSNTP